MDRNRHAPVFQVAEILYHDRIIKMIFRFVLAITSGGKVRSPVKGLPGAGAS